MTPFHDARLADIDEQLLHLLHERIQVCGELTDSGKPILPEDEAEILASWLEQAADFEMDESQAEKICRLVLQLCKEEGE